MALIYFTPGLKGSYLILSLQKGITGYYLLSSSSLLFTPFLAFGGALLICHHQANLALVGFLLKQDL